MKNYQDIRWISIAFRKVEIVFQTPQLPITLRTEASNSGWAAHCLIYKSTPGNKTFSSYLICAAIFQTSNC